MSSPGVVTVSRMDRGYLISVQGKGTCQESPAVRDFACGAMEDGAAVIVDLNECEYLDSTFLGCLVVLNNRGKEKDDRFHVVADDAAKERLLHCTRLDQVLSFCECPEHGEGVELKPVRLERREFAEHLLSTHDELSKLDSPSSTAFRAVADQLRKELGSS